MENRVLASILLFALFFPNYTFAYDPPTTHAGLTQESVNFYNLYHGDNKISKENLEKIVQGSIDEDFPDSRSLNHFYDPTRNIGLNGMSSAKYWAFHDTGAIGTIKLDIDTPFFSKRVEGEVNEYSWPRVIENYAKGDMDEAYTGLGHILHLLEDMTVPDHVRNDPHMGEGSSGLYTNPSSYESWAEKNMNRETMRGMAEGFFVKGDKPERLGNLELYFDTLASYTNANFYSDDTINNKYNEFEYPRIVESDDEFAYGLDSLSGSKIRLLNVELVKDGKNYYLYRDSKTEVIQDYFKILSEKSITNNAGVIELFFREGEKAKTEYLKKQKEDEDRRLSREKELQNSQSTIRAEIATLEHKLPNFMSPVVSLLGNSMSESLNFLSWSKDGLSRIGDGLSSSFDNSLAFVGSILNTTKSLASTASFVGGEAVSIVKDDISLGGINTIKFVNNHPTVVLPGPYFALHHSDSGSTYAPIDTVTREGGGTPLPSTPIIPGPIYIPISPGFGGGAPIVDKSKNEAPSTSSLGGDGAISSEASSTPDVPPPLPIDTTPPDFNYSIKECAHSIIDGTCTVATSSVTLEMSSVASDLAYYAVDVDGVFATSTFDTALADLIPSGTHNISAAAYDLSGNVATGTPIVVTYIKRPIVISEIAWAGTEEGVDRQWIELYNNTGSTINLSEFILRGKSGTPNFLFPSNISPNSYYLIDRDTEDVTPSIPVDFVSGMSGPGDPGINKIEDTIELVHTEGGDGEEIVDSTPLLGACGGVWCAGSATDFSTMARVNLNSSGMSPSNWISDNTIFKSILDSTGRNVKGSPGVATDPCILPALSSFLPLPPPC